MRVSKQKTTPKGDVPHFSSFSRTSDTCFETNLTSEREREPIEDDDERLAVMIGDMPPQLPRRGSYPKIPNDQAFERILLKLGQDAPSYICVVESS